MVETELIDNFLEEIEEGDGGEANEFNSSNQRLVKRTYRAEEHRQMNRQHIRAG